MKIQNMLPIRFEPGSAPGPGALFLLPLLFLLACDHASPTLMVTGYEPLNPPPVFARWYAEAEECAGTSGRFQSVRWFTADAIHLSDGNGDWTAYGGMYVRDTGIIIRRDLVGSRGAVRHESVHHVLGETGHEHPAFERCG